MPSRLTLPREWFLTSLILFVLVYALLIAADGYLLFKFAKAGPVSQKEPVPADEEVTVA